MPSREMHNGRTTACVPEIPGILTASEVLATGRSIVAMQQPTGAIGWPDGHVNAWDNVECAMALSACGLRTSARRAYEWLRQAQRADGSWPRRTVADAVTDAAAESNQAAYVAVGVWHELCITGDTAFAERMWPVTRRAIDFAVGLQAPRGEIFWEVSAAGKRADYALLAGCSSTHQSLRYAVMLAEHLGEPQPEWELAADQLAHAVACHPEAFADKSRFSMDWYYPVLGGPVRGIAASRHMSARWREFVVPGLGARCVNDQPWVTGAETCELVLALDAIGDREHALALYADIQHLRHDDGSYWTGWQFVNRTHFPAERSSWTAAAVILAADALSGATGGSGIFRNAAARLQAAAPVEPGACGCQQKDALAMSGSPGSSADAGPGSLQHP
jgi:hypothetical protein